MSSSLSCNPAKPAGIAGGDPGWTGGADFADLAKDELEEGAKDATRARHRGVLRAQELLWATTATPSSWSSRRMDAAGKDGNQARDVRREPAGRPGRLVQAALREELDHDFLWRVCEAPPERGRIGIFNRSHYEEVVALGPPRSGSNGSASRPDRGKRFWQERYEDINAFERHLDRNGTQIVKFFLNVSKDGAEAALPRPPRQARTRTGSSRGRPRGAGALGRVHGRLRGRAHRHSTRGRRGT